MESEMSARELVKHAEMAVTELAQKDPAMSAENETRRDIARTYALIAVAKSLQSIDQTLTRIHGHMKQNF